MCIRDSARCRSPLAVAAAFRRAAPRTGRDRSRGGVDARWVRRESPPRDRRPRSGRARTARRLALQPRQRLHPASYSLSSDQFAVIVKTKAEGCLKYGTLVEADRLAWKLQQVPGVQTTVSLANAVRQITAGTYEGSPKWLTIARNQDVLNYGAQQASVNNPD